MKDLKRTFSKQTVDAMLEAVIDEYFAADNKLSMWEVVDYVKCLYADEISTLDDETTIIW